MPQTICLLGRDAEPTLQHVVEDQEGGLRAGLEPELRAPPP